MKMCSACLGKGELVVAKCMDILTCWKCEGLGLFLNPWEREMNLLDKLVYKIYTVVMHLTR